VVAVCRIWCLVLKLSVQCGVEGCVSGLRAGANLCSRESIFRLDYFSVFFKFLMLLFLLYCIVLLEELVCFLFIYFFDSRLIPTLFLILGSGYQHERVQAGIYLLLYTLLASLPLLVGILFVYNSLGSLCLFMLCGSSSLAGGLF
jgi:NADH-ubiquinone oxidoreductase chain 4